MAVYLGVRSKSIPLRFYDIFHRFCNKKENRNPLFLIMLLIRQAYIRFICRRYYCPMKNTLLAIFWPNPDQEQSIKNKSVASDTVCGKSRVCYSATKFSAIPCDLIGWLSKNCFYASYFCETWNTFETESRKQGNFMKDFGVIVEFYEV